LVPQEQAALSGQSAEAGILSLNEILWAPVLACGVVLLLIAYGAVNTAPR
jgi:hypothetical protein